MAFAIAVSLLVSFTLTPMLASRWLRTPAAPGERRKTTCSSASSDAFYRPIERAYMAHPALA